MRSCSVSPIPIRYCCWVVASTQFFTVPANLMKKKAYLQTGTWAKSHQGGELFGEIVLHLKIKTSLYKRDTLRKMPTTSTYHQ